MDYMPELIEKAEKLNVVHMHCVDSINNCNLRVTNKFYEDKFEKSYILGKIEAYKNIMDIVELPLMSSYIIEK